MTDASLVNLSELTAAQIAELLTQARKAEKAKKQQAAALPVFSYLCVMEDSSLVFWSGKSEDSATAEEKAKAYAERNGKKVFGMCLRPNPGPRGRKAVASDDTQGDAS